MSAFKQLSFWDKPDRQTQVSGNNSTNIQAGGDVTTGPDQHTLEDWSNEIDDIIAVTEINDVARLERLRDDIRSYLKG